MRIEGDLGAGDKVAGVAVTLRELGTLAGPAQAASELARRPGDQGRFGIDRIFWPEAAADILGHQPELVLGHVQDALAHQAVRDLHALRGEGDGDKVVRRVPGRPCRARLHVMDDLARRADGERRDVCGAREGGVGRRGIALAPAAHQVARHVVMDQWRIRCERLRRRDDGRQRLVVDLQHFRRIARLVERAGHDHGDDVADMAHLARRHRQMGGLAMAVAGRVLDLADRRQVADLVGHKVVGGVDRRDAGRGEGGRLVDAGEPRMGVRRAYEQHGKRARRRGVVGIAAAAGQQPAVLASRQRLAELDWSIHGVGYTGFWCRPVTMKIWGSDYSCSWRRLLGVGGLAAGARAWQLGLHG